MTFRSGSPQSLLPSNRILTQSPYVPALPFPRETGSGDGVAISSFVGLWVFWGYGSDWRVGYILWNARDAKYDLLATTSGVVLYMGWRCLSLRFGEYGARPQAGNQIVHSACLVTLSVYRFDVMVLQIYVGNTFRIAPDVHTNLCGCWNIPRHQLKALLPPVQGTMSRCGLCFDSGERVTKPFRLRNSSCKETQQKREAQPLAEDGTFILVSSAQVLEMSILDHFPTSNGLAPDSSESRQIAGLAKANSWSNGGRTRSHFKGTEADLGNPQLDIVGRIGQRKRRHSDDERMDAKLERLRRRRFKLRAMLFERRQELAEARLEVTRADEGFMQLIREMRTQQSDDKHEDFMELDKYYSQLQAARDEYGFLYETYNALEEKLDREEYEVMQLQEQLRNSEELQQHRLGGSGSLSYDSADESDDLTLAENIQYTLYDEYLSRLGDADLLREHLVELRLDYHRLQEEAQDLRHKVGFRLTPDDQATIDNLSIEVTLDKVQEIDTDVKRLINECVQAGLLSEEEDDEEDNEGTDLHCDSNRLTVSESKLYGFPLEQLNDAKVYEKSESLISNLGDGDRGDRISRWLLLKLRQSGSAVELLERLSGSTGGDLRADTSKWQEDVLNFWFIDDFDRLPPSVDQMEAMATSPFAGKDSETLFNVDPAQLFKFVMSSSMFNKATAEGTKGGAAKSVRRIWILGCRVL